MFNALNAVRELTSSAQLCLITITQAKGSTPRNTGTVMVVTKDGTHGSIGGGKLELQAIAHARNLLQTQGKTQEHHVILGPDMEQCCGGALTYRLEVVDLQTALQKLSAQPRTQVYLFGAGHVGTALLHALAPLPFSVSCFDTRLDKCTQPCHPGLDPGSRHSAQRRDPGAEAGVTAKVTVIYHFHKPNQTVLTAPKNTHFLVMTHDHNLDYELVRAILKRDDFAFLGLIGSKTKRARFLSRLKKDGFTDLQLSRLTCPIGLEDIKGKEPEIIAASVAAQLLQIRTNYGD